jgi:hypothetical protein
MWLGFVHLDFLTRGHNTHVFKHNPGEHWCADAGSGEAGRARVSLNHYPDVTTRTNHSFALKLIAATPDTTRFTLGKGPVQTILLNWASTADAFGLVFTKPTLSR